MGSARRTGLEAPESAAPEAPGETYARRAVHSSYLLLLVTFAIAAALVLPWVSPLAAGGSSPAEAGEQCLDADAETYPVRLNVGTYRPPRGIPEQAPRAANNGHAIDRFRYLVTLDNSGDPANPDPASHPSVHATAGSSPILAEGTVEGKTKLLHLPKGCRWLVTVEANVDDEAGDRRTSGSHAPWGAVVDLVDEPGPGYRPRGADANGDVVEWIDEIPYPLPLGKLAVRVFADTSPTDGKPEDVELQGGAGPGLDGFEVVLEREDGGVVTENGRGDPICSDYDEDGKLVRGSGGRCRTDRDGTLVITDLASGGYEIRASPPGDQAHAWHGAVPTAAFAGDSTGSGAGTADASPGPSLRGVVLPLSQTDVHWFGFARPHDLPAGPAGRIRACAVHAVSFPPYESGVLTKHEPIVLGWAALSRTNGEQVYARRLGDGPACPGGAIDIQGVAPGDYVLLLWDERLERVARPVEVTVPPGANGTGAVVDLRGDDGKGTIGLRRRSGWLSGTVFRDEGVAASGAQIPGGARNGVRDCVDRRNRGTCEPGLAGERVEIRFRDGSLKDVAVTDSSGRYEFPAELSELSKFVISTVASARYRASGPCLYSDALEKRGAGWAHSQYNPLASCVPVRRVIGHGVGVSQLTAPGHRATVDWGLYEPGAAGPAQIAGTVYYATTRAEQDPATARAESYEPGIAGVPVNLYWTGPNQTWDGGPGPGGDDVLVGRYARGFGTDSFEHPTLENQGPNGGCDVLDSAGNPVYPAPKTSFGIRVAPNCLELGTTSNETKDGTHDGAFVFEDMCDPERGGWNDALADEQGLGRGCDRRVSLRPGDYVVEVAAAENAAYPGFPYEIVKEEDVDAGPGEPAGADSKALYPCVGPEHVVRNARSPFDGRRRPLCTQRELTLAAGLGASAVDFFLFTETPIPGRVFGRVLDGDRVETDPDSPWYGRPHPVAGVPIGIRDYSYRLLETVVADEYGSYEAVLPSARADCPAGVGACPAGYLVVVNDPVAESAATGRVKTTGTSVLGTGTRFGPEISVGDRIRIGSETRAVTAVGGSTSLTVDRAWSRRSGPAALYVLHRNPSFDPRYGTVTRAFDVLPGKTALVETRLAPISGPGCASPAGPELFRVEPKNGDGSPTDPDRGVVVARRLPATSELRDVTLSGLGFGVERASSSFPSGSGYVSLVHPDGTRYDLDDDSYYGGSGSPAWSDERITFRFPRTIGSAVLPGAPYQVLVTAPPRDPATSGEPLTASTGITLHYVERGAYDPPRRYVDGLRGTDRPRSGGAAHPYRTIQYAIDRVFAERAAGALVVVLPGVYRENPVLYVRARLQGFGPGGTVWDGAEGDGAEDDVRRSSRGTVVDASFFNDDATVHRRWRTAIDGRPDTYFPGGPPEGLEVETHAGAGITVVGARDTFETENPELDAAAIDGLTIHSARPDAVFGSGGGGGIFVNGHGRHLRLTNNLVVANQGTLGGGIVVGRPYPGADGEADNDDPDVRIAYNRIVGNGAAYGAGGIALFQGSDGYLVDHNVVCSNVSNEDGGGVSHAGRSPRGRIAENVVSFNVAGGAGGGLSIAGAGAGGTGVVKVERNVISSNLAGEGGGGIDVLGAVQAQPGSAAPDEITIENDQVTNNVAHGAGGAIQLRDSPNVRIVNDTIAENASTASCGSCLGGPPHSGGVASRLHSARLQALLPAGSALFSSPLLLNDLFYGNRSYAFDPAQLPVLAGLDALTAAGLGDFEVVGRADLRFRPWYSTLSAPYQTGLPAADATNRVLAGNRGENPFRDVYRTELDVGFDAGTGRAGLRVVDPFALDSAGGGSGAAPGDYHLCDSTRASSRADAAACSETPLDAGAAVLPAEAAAGTIVPTPPAGVPAPAVDIDGDERPVPLRARSLSAASGYDIGADELAGLELTRIEAVAQASSRSGHPHSRRTREPSAEPVSKSLGSPPEPTERRDTELGRDLPAAPGHEVVTPAEESDADTGLDDSDPLPDSPPGSVVTGPGSERSSQAPRLSRCRLCDSST
jgi:hypothetical protein